MSQIKATIIAHSKSSVNGKEIVTFELEYPRFIHSELMTHRLFSRNAASSRAIPVSAMCDQVCDSPAIPIHWGKNQRGMQANEQLDDYNISAVKALWEEQAQHASLTARYMADHGLHKQIVNRILEPFQMMKTVVTSTEWDNWFWLRNHPDAQPEIKRLAEVMLEALANSEAIPLFPGDWHVPYYDNGTWIAGVDEKNTLEEALAISASCCAQVSYRKLDDSLEKAKDIFAKLIESKPCHASPCEHQATPMDESGEFWDESGDYGVNCLCDPDTWQEGITHVDRNGNFWSGNLKGWIQHRQLIEGNVCWEYKENK